MNNGIEILAPAGAFESIKAAAATGATAVYVGAQSFSARAAAANFGSGELSEAVAYCHERGMKLYLAVNTLIRDDELPQALELVKNACECGVDALIVQDLGLASLIKQAAPEMPLHASTQMSVHTPQGARLLYSLGFKRVVLARELSRDEIFEIVNSCPIETEVFVHGALCMCVSGQCEFSAVLGGRSGNRGRCAQPCRLPFYIDGGNGYALSLKDNSLLEHLSELEEMGVTSAKIEGRMKRPEYVAAAVDACEAALSGKDDCGRRARLEAVFSRSGFTDGYYTGKIDKNMFGVRSKENVTAADGRLMSQLRNLYKDERKRFPLSFKLVLKSEEPARLYARSGGFSAEAVGDIPEKAVRTSINSEKARAQLVKTGGTPFIAENIELEIDDGLAFPVSMLNAMRRSCIEKIEEQLRFDKRKDFKDVSLNIGDTYTAKKTPSVRVRLADCGVPDEFKSCELVYVPLFSPADEIKRLISSGFRLGAELPRCIFGAEEAVKKQIEKIKGLGVEDALVSNLGAIDLALNAGMKAHGSFALNAYNTYALNELELLRLSDVELSPELAAEQIKRLGGNIKRGAVSCGEMPLMVTRVCPAKNGGQSCSECGGKKYITDRKNNRLMLKCDGFSTEVLNPVLMYAQHILQPCGCLDFFTLRFSTQSKAQMLKIYNAVVSGRHLSGDYTNGMYKRGVI